MNHSATFSIRAWSRRARRGTRLVLRPVVAALAAWLPLASLAAGPVKLTIPAPPKNAVPVPGATWRTYGNGNTSGPINVTNGAGGVDQAISQTSQKAIYSWQSFDIGSASSVTFDMALPGSSALNRVMGSTAPSQIFGRLTATNGGELYLINANGILFGRGAVVNTGSLIASTLDVTDDNFKASLVPAITANDTFDAIAFQYTGDPANFTDTQNFVQVDPGAAITTGSGGRVFLFAKNVVNAGTITSPDGQVALGAGSEVFLRLPSSHPEIYATEDNAQLPVLRGLLVEVGDKYDQDTTLPADVHVGTVTNVLGGTVSAPRGNATLVGLAVNQMGRVSATTSVSENGSIFLRAEGDAAVDPVNANYPVVAQKSGTLTLGPGSSTDILPDTQLVDGKVPTSTDNAGFIASRIDLVGRTVELQSGAQVVAPGADVNVRAETAPTLAYTQQATPDPEARVVMDAGAVIDLSGTSDAIASVERWFVTTDLLTSNDLADAPLQKDGILYRSHVTIDVREDSKILGDLARYRDAIARTVDERLSTGGHVDLFAPGAVLLAAGSTIDVSGGRMTFTGATVKPTELVGTDGAVWNLNDAPADQLYVMGLNLQNANATRYNRWGPIATPGMSTSGVMEPGYVQGQAAGSVSINAPTVIEQGRLEASTTAGTRQAMGLDPIAQMGRLFLGDAAGFDKFEGSQPSSASTLLPDFAITQDGPIVPDLLWEAPLTGDLPTSSGMALATFQDAGFGSTTISARNDVTLEAGAGLVLPDHASLTMQSALGTVNLGGDITARDGSIALTSQFGAANVGAGSHVDLSGRWINQFVDQAQEDTSATAGGSFSARGERGVSLGAQSVIDVSGGAAVSQGGTITGANAGSITLLAGRTDQNDSPADPAAQRQLVLGGTLVGEAMQGATGGSLALRAPSIRLGTAADGQPSAALTLDPAMLTQGGFSSYTLDGLAFLDVAAGTTVAPTRQGWYATDPNARYAATGSRIADVLTLGSDPTSIPPAVSIALQSSGVIDSGQQFATGGAVTVDAGARVNLVPGATFAATGAESVAVDGAVTDHGGSVTLKALGNGDPTRASYVWVGAGATIDVSGTTIVTPATSGLAQGTVQDGGNVSLLAAGGVNHMGASLVVQQGARIALDGGHGTLDVSERTQAGNAIVHETLDGQGGTLTLATTSDLMVEGTVTARGGGASAAGGAVNVQLLGARDDFTSIGGFSNSPAIIPDLQVQQAATHVTSALTADQLPSAAAIAANNDAGNSNATVSAQWFASTGASDLGLAAGGRLHAVGDVDLRVARNLVIDAPALAVDAGHAATLRGATTLVGNVSAPANPNNALQLTTPVAQAGTGTLTIAGTDVILDGDLVTQGAQSLSISAAHDLQLRSSLASNANAGTLQVAGDVAISAGQVYPATGQAYTVDTTDPADGTLHDVSITGGKAALPKPLSAGGSLDVKAATIEQGGVVRAPFGSITLSANDALTLGDGSETSVSGAGLVVAYGTTVNGATDWIAPGGSLTAPISALPGKTLSLNAGTLTTTAGAKVDLAGGGTVVAYEFVPGPGGSQDVFAGGDGAYAIVPGVSGLAPYDPTYGGTYAALGRQLVIGAGAPVPAGTYTLLPARYALLPGAFLVTPASGAPMAMNTAVANADGSVLVGARTASANTGFSSSGSGTWRVQSSVQAQKSSEVVATSADTYFAQLAIEGNTTAPRGAADGGVLAVTAGAAQIAGTFDFRAATDPATGKPAGFGGVAAFSANHIVIADTAGAAVPDTLALTAQELDAMAPASLLLGATVGDAGTQGTPLDVTAQSVTFANTQTPLQVADVVAAAKTSVTVKPNAQIVAGTPSPLAAAPAAFQIEGDGAALRVADVTGATLTRTGSDGLGGALWIGGAARIDAGAGSLTLDGSDTTVAAGNAQFHAADITLAAGAIQVGTGTAPATLVLNDALLAQVDNATHLTLRGYDRIAFLADTRIAGGALDSVTLDTPKLLAVAGDASVDAGEIALANTSTKDQQHGAAGPGTLTLHADARIGSGRVLLDDGIVSIIGTQNVVLDADRALVLDGSGTLNAGGDMTVQAPVVLAQAPASHLTSVADATLSAAGTVRFAGGGTKDAAQPAAGAALVVDAASIVQGTDIELPSGQVTFGAASGGVSFAAGSRTDVAGRTVTIDGTAIATSGGTLSASAAAGNIAVASGATLDVSAAGAAAGGTLTLAAPQGTLGLDGTLLGTSGNPATGASLVLDAGFLPALAQVAGIQQAAWRNFGGTLDLRQRGAGTVTLDRGTTLLAHQVSIDNDGGAIDLAGTIDASGGQASRIDVAARDDLTVSPGAHLSVHDTGGHVRGGSIDLTTADGTLDLQAGATLDLRSDGSQRDSDIQGGRLTLRAPRTGIDANNPGGTDVAIATIGATVEGASTVDVQAVQVFDGVTHITNDLNDTSAGTLEIHTLDEAEQHFLGSNGNNADAIARRLAAGNGAVESVLFIHPEDEIRSSGDLTITTSPSWSQLSSDDWVLRTYSVDDAFSSKHAGDASITLRAAGNLVVPRTISAGFEAMSYKNYDDERLAAVTSTHAGEIRLVAGADMGAADALRTGNPKGNLSIGRTDQDMHDGTDDYNIVAVRSTTGDVALAAGGDVDMSHGHTLVYTTGRDVTDDDATAVRNGLFLQSGGFAFDVGAGDISVRAGGSVLGNDDLRDNGSFIAQAEELSSFRSQVFESTAFYGDGTQKTFDGWNLQTGAPYVTGVEHGVFSFGGGNIAVKAGADVTNLVAVSPSSGFLFRDADGNAGPARIFPGGNVSVDAGRDVVDGLFEAGGPRVDVNAGRDFAWRAAHYDFITEPGLRLLTENGTIEASARRDATFGYVADAYYTQDQALTGLDANSSASVQAAGGNVSMLLTPESPFNSFNNIYNDYVTARFSVTAPGGDLRIGDGEAMGLGGVELDQIPVQQSSFDLLAAGDVTVAHSGTFTIDVMATADLSKGPQFVQDLSLGVPHSPLDDSDRTPVHIASGTGDVALAQLLSARPVRIDAGEDVILPAYVSITHQPVRTDGDTVVGETSSIQAGRDVLLEPDYRNLVTGGVNVAGPGELLVLAGRNVDLGNGVAGSSVAYVSGLIATGNTTNGLLPAVGSNITVVAGLRADGADYTQAARMGFAALGANGLTDHAGDLYALLSASGTGVVALGSSQAKSFAGETTAQQLAQVKTLVGETFYDAQVAAYVRSQPGQSALTDAQALAAFASLSTAKQAAAPGVVLAQAFAGRSQDQRDGFIAELAGAAGHTSYPDALVAYMQRLQGRTFTLAAAIPAFEALPLVQQIPLLDSVLISEVRIDGRAAAGATGIAQEDAYNRGYITISALFPAERPEGNIEMPEAAVKTLQQASITLLAPGGGVDAGGLSASTISPNNLGVVTVSGGDISAVVRDDFLVNQSRVFTLAPGDLLIWSSEGNIDAGRGAKTVVGAPAPVLRLDPVTGLLFLDTSGSFTGSGIAVLDPASTLDLYAPSGAINAGEAGIKSAGNAFFAAQTFIGADNLSVGGHSVGAPPPVNATATVGLASAGNALAASANQVADDQKEERRKRRLRRNLLIEFLGFGPES